MLFALPDGSKEAVGLVAVRPQAHEAAAGLAAAAQAGGFGHLELGQQFARIQRLKIAVGLVKASAMASFSCGSMLQVA